mgnify:CR=1 FL=1
MTAMVSSHQSGVRSVAGAMRAMPAELTRMSMVPHSALKIRESYGNFDAERRFNLNYHSVPDNKACECGAILRGVKRPQDCKIFGTVCTPDNPVGSCMVSSEGACAAHYSYGRYKDKTT